MFARFVCALFSFCAGASCKIRNPSTRENYRGMHLVLFDDEKKDMPLCVSNNGIFVNLEELLLPIPCCHGIVSTFELVVF